tara:strand:+ start:308 stop:652 length:345 start_codon:yes stop_codon:yes gene_type:complete
MKSFINNIIEPVFATEEQKEKEIWDVEGRLKNGNQSFKFDIRPLKAINNDRSEKIGYFNTKADKIVFEAINQWIIFDTKELHEHIEFTGKRDFNIQELLNNLTWNLIINKVNYL